MHYFVSTYQLFVTTYLRYYYFTTELVVLPTPCTKRFYRQEVAHKILVKLNPGGRLIIPEFQLDKNIKSCQGSHSNEKRDWGAVVGSTNYGKLPPESFCRKTAAWAIVTHTRLACIFTHTHVQPHTSYPHTLIPTISFSLSYTHTHARTHYLLLTLTHTLTRNEGGWNHARFHS